MRASPTFANHPAQTAASPCDAAPEAWARAAMERQLFVLGRLAEMGLAVAAAIERQATTAAGLDDGRPVAEADAIAVDAVRVVPGDVALAYARVSRAVRMAVVLQTKVIADLRMFDHFSARDHDKARQAALSGRKAAVQRIVGRVAGAERGEGYADPLTVHARLEHDDIYGDILNRPVSEIVADICRDLGLSPDWTRLAQEAWAREEIDSGAPGSPLAMAEAPQTPIPAATPFRLAPQAASP